MIPEEVMKYIRILEKRLFEVEIEVELLKQKIEPQKELDVIEKDDIQEQFRQYHLQKMLVLLEELITEAEKEGESTVVLKRWLKKYQVED